MLICLFYFAVRLNPRGPTPKGAPVGGVVRGHDRVCPILDRGAWLAREAVRVEPGTVAHVGADVAARAAGLAQGEVVAVHHA